MIEVSKTTVPFLVLLTNDESKTSKLITLLHNGEVKSSIKMEEDYVGCEIAFN